MRFGFKGISWRQNNFAKNCFGFKDVSWRTFLWDSLIFQKVVLGLRNFLGRTFKGHFLEVCNTFFWMFFVLHFFWKYGVGLNFEKTFSESIFLSDFFFLSWRHFLKWHFFRVRVLSWSKYFELRFIFIRHFFLEFFKVSVLDWSMYFLQKN